MESVRISVVVPVYNVERYLEACLNSISAQSYPNFEAILIDDGSTDRSGEKCDLYVKTDKRFRVIHKDNGGLSKARNLGIDESKGEWVTFVDSDDEIHPDYLSILLNGAESTESSISLCNYQEIWEGESPQTEIDERAIMVLNSDGVISRMLSGKDVSFMIACAKLYKRSLLEGVRFRTMICEDTDFLSRLFLKVNQAAYIDNKLYYYFRRKGSISLSSNFRASQVLANWGIRNYYKEVAPRYEVMAARMCVRSLVKYYRESDGREDSLRDKMNQIKKESWKIAYGDSKVSVEKLKMWCGINFPKAYDFILRMREKGII